MFKVKSKSLLIIAGLVWLIAGFNVARLGLISFFTIEKKFNLYIFSLIIFILFGFMFYKMTKKHTKRILAYKRKIYFWKFFDKKSYLIMAFMMGGGIGLRSMKILPDYFIGFFYTGLGFSLALAGLIFIKNYFSIIKER
ncbi:hypothetical protein [Anaerococcus senegalensis]|uniref:hypothetical protein n=1 Tax=Anaerococcus senegalensis TaxID=1288120 RepID=UPI0002DAC82F|nr:hypothetical protein [Anaerococcus senegalensis]